MSFALQQHKIRQELELYWTQLKSLYIVRVLFLPLPLTSALVFDVFKWDRFALEKVLVFLEADGSEKSTFFWEDVLHLKDII